MFGMEQMIKQMLADAGIDIDTLQREGIKAYQEARTNFDNLVRAQQQLVDLMQHVFATQRRNEQKLDAIIAHLQIPMNSEDKDDGRQLQLINGTERVESESGDSGKLN